MRAAGLRHVTVEVNKGQGRAAGELGTDQQRQLLHLTFRHVGLSHRRFGLKDGSLVVRNCDDRADLADLQFEIESAIDLHCDHDVFRRGGFEALCFGSYFVRVRS